MRSTQEEVTVDDVVRMAIEDLFPSQTVPDENNYIGGGRQYKAPDHSLFGGKILIERKSRNGEDNSRFYHKLREIAANQGAPFYAVGRGNLRQIIRSLPDPEAANRQFTDFMLRKTMKHIHDARRKLEEYEGYVSGGGHPHSNYIRQHNYKVVNRI